MARCDSPVQKNAGIENGVASVHHVVIQRHNHGGDVGCNGTDNTRVHGTECLESLITGLFLQLGNDLTTHHSKQRNMKREVCR